MVAADGGVGVHCGRLMKKCRLDIAKVRLMASVREETKGRVWIPYYRLTPTGYRWMDGMTEGGGVG